VTEWGRAGLKGQKRRKIGRLKKGIVPPRCWGPEQRREKETFPSGDARSREAAQTFTWKKQTQKTKGVINPPAR